MARDSRRQRRTRTTSIDDLPDDLLELVLLRVRTPICLFRAAAACKRWRLVIAGDGFLQRVRSLHRPNHLLGHYSVKTTRTKAGLRTDVEFVPFPARPAVHLRQRLSLDFPVDGGHILRRSPELTDSRGGLLAFVRDNWYAMVCDPWTRQSTRLLEFPWERPGDRKYLYEYNCLGAFILDAGDGDDGNGDDKSSLMSSFSVLCVCLITDKMDDTTTAEACVFSARDNGWIRWTVSSDVFRDMPRVDMDERFVGRAGGSIFFSGIETMDNTTANVLLVLDEATGDFSTITLPLARNDADNNLYFDRENLRVVNGGAGTLVSIIRLVKSDLEMLKVTRTHGGWECTVERSVDLCQVTNIIRPIWVNRPWRFLDRTTTAAATLVLRAFSPSSTLFSLDVRTMKLQPASKTATILNAERERVFPYELPWPQTIN